MKQNILLQNDSDRIKLSVEDDFTILDLKEHAEKEWKIPVQCQKIIFLGQILKDKETIIEANRHKIKNPVLTLVKISGKKRKGSENGSATQNLAGEKLKLCYILLANIKSGNDAFEKEISPECRERINEANGMECKNIKKPTVKELGIFHQKMVAEINRYNKNMFTTSDLLIDDPLLLPDEAKFEEVRRKIQLTMDMGRYISPLMKINSGFIIPLRQNPVRYLSYRENPLSTR